MRFYSLGLEFVSPLLVGIFIGRGVDFYLGSRPWGLVIFLLLGIMAGILTVYRAANTFIVQEK